MQIAYIGVPIALGADRKGVELAPDFFRNEGVVKMLDHICGCYDLGNVQSSIIAEEKHAADPAVKYLSTIVDISSQLRDKVASVIRQGYFPLIVGGDHSLGLGSVAGAALAYNDIAVIWFDAHGDFNTEETSPTGNLHGMPAAAAMGWCKSELSSVATKTIPPRNFFWIGARDLDEGEKAFAEKTICIFIRQKMFAKEACLMLWMRLYKSCSQTASRISILVLILMEWILLSFVVQEQKSIEELIMVNSILLLIRFSLQTK